MKNLITGGAGFIGSHLAQALLERGEEVIVIDDLSTGSMENIRHLIQRPGFSYRIGTILNARLMKRLIKRCDRIFHLAAAVGVKYIIDNPLESIHINVRGTEIVLETASLLGKKKVILASTSEVYGKDRPGKRYFKETDDRLLGSTTISRWSYSCTKALDEFLALAYWREKKLPVVIVRLFNTCGPRQSSRYGMVIPRLVKQALRGKPLTVYGNGKQTRSFSYVKDVVEAVTLLAENRKAVGEIFNIGNPSPISIDALAKRIKKLTDSMSRIIHIPYEKAYQKGFEDMKHRHPDIAKLKKITGFSPKTDIDSILTETIQYFKGYGEDV